MQFFEAKRQRSLRTTLFLVVFFVLGVGVSFLFQLIFDYLAKEGYIPPVPYSGAFLLTFIILISFFYYLAYVKVGGKLAPESMGGREIIQPRSIKEEELVNIVHEMAIASRTPIPKIYLIKANEINAFAAGVKPENSVIAVTTGALNSLTRDELQAVVAHEFGHIASGDVKIGMRLAALLMGFFFVFYIGLRLLEGSFFYRGDKKGGSIQLIALLLFLGGVILWFGGAVLRACVNRQREYMADASSVEFTRQTAPMVSALRKIEEQNLEKHDMPKSGLSYAHLYFDNRSFWCRLFATHPPIAKRIAALLGNKSPKK